MLKWFPDAMSTTLRIYSQVSIVHSAPLSHPSALGVLPVGQTTATAATATAENSQVELRSNIVEVDSF